MRFRKFFGFRGKLPTTRWTIVKEAGQKDVASRDKALAELCAIYYEPVFEFIRAQGRPADEARDLTQGFFAARIVDEKGVSKVDHDRGRFRSWLLTAVKSYLANVRKHDNAAKRRPDEPLLSLDTPEKDEQCPVQVGHSTTPERIYERRWAIVLLEQALRKLGEIYEKRGKRKLFEKMIPYLVDAGSDDRQAIAKELGMREETFNTALHRCRIEFREQVRDEIAHTVIHESEIEDELRYIHSGLQAR